jgi:hypothetical protein
MIVGIGTLSTFVGREQDAHKRDEGEEGDGACEQHVEFLQMMTVDVVRRSGPPRPVEAGTSCCSADHSLTNRECQSLIT